MAPPPVSPRNLLDNGDFESGSGGWQAFGSARLRRTTDAARSGESCLLATERSDDFVGLGWPLEELAVPGTEYEFGVWVRLVGELDGTGVVDVSTWTACQTRQRATRIAGAIVGPSWVELGGTLVVPDCRPETLTIVVQGPPPGVSFCIDDARLVRTR